MASQPYPLPDRIRAFVALRMSSEVEEALAGFIDEVRTDGDGIRWARRDNFHLTLRFLGNEVDIRRLGPLGQALATIAVETQPFEVEARGIGAFPDMSHPRVIWVGLIGDGLVRLAERVERAAVRAGFDSEQRPYSPHLTIGRVRGLKGWVHTRRRLETAIERSFGSSLIDAMTLYRSILGRETSTYVELARYGFGLQPNP